MASGSSSKGDPGAGLGTSSPDRVTLRAGVAVAVPTVWSGSSPAATPPNGTPIARSHADGGPRDGTRIQPRRVSVHFGQRDRVQDHLAAGEDDAFLRSGTRWAWFFTAALLVVAAVLITWILSAGQAGLGAGSSS